MADPVWLLVMFDLPVLTKIQRRESARYRKLLLNEGFDQLQLSVYSKYLINATGVRSCLRPIKEFVPVEGAVRVFLLTDTQWASQFRFWGPTEVPPEKKPGILELFETWEEA